MRIGLCMLFAVAASAISLSPAAAQPARVTAIGDSLTDEYLEQTYGAYARSWVQILTQAGRIDPGPSAADAGIGYWNEPRRAGFRDNWGRYGASMDDAIVAYGQHTGAAASVSSFGAEYAILFIGGNDFGPWRYGTYDFVYRNEWTAADGDAFIASRMAMLRTMLDAIRPTGGKIVLSSIVDFSFMPFLWGSRPGPASRDRATAFMARCRDATRRLADEYDVVFLDMFRLNVDLFGDNVNARSSVLVGNVPINMRTWGTQANIAFTEDGIHPSTIIQAIWAQAFATALSAGHGEPLTGLSESEMLAAAGLTYGGADTLSQVLRPWREYVTNFACPADYSLDGSVGVQDIFDFLNAYFRGDVRADMNSDGTVAVQDIFSFLSAYFTACP